MSNDTIISGSLSYQLERYLKPGFFVVLAVLVFLTFPLGGFGPGGLNNIHVYQALAFLDGHIHLPFSERGLHFDIAFYDGRFQCPFPPMPAMVLVPFVALFGESTRVVPISLALTALNIVVLSSLLKKLAIESRFIPWILAAFFLGSPYWGVVRGSAIGSYFSHVVAVTGILLALNEAFGKGRGALVGTFLGMSFLSRQLSIYTAIVLCAVLWQHRRFHLIRQKLGTLVAFGGAFAVAVGIYLTFNWLRFGNPLDTGYSMWWEVDSFMIERMKQFGPFHPVYFFHNFAYMFLQGFHLEFSLPMYLNKPHLDPFGTSLTFASPFIFFAFKARGQKLFLWGAWLSIGLCLFHALLYFGNGWVQENGIRYALDFFPVLMVLVAVGIKNIDSTLWKGAIAYSVGLNLLAFSLISHAWDLQYQVLRWGKQALLWLKGA
jgi:hypothetical protein